MLIILMAACREGGVTPTPITVAVTTATSGNLLPTETMTASPLSSPTFTPVSPTSTPVSYPLERLVVGLPVTLVNDDGSDLEQPAWLEKFFPPAVGPSFLALSPDGRYLAFLAEGEPLPCTSPANAGCYFNPGYYLADLSNEVVSQLDLEYPAWAPDSQQFVGSKTVAMADVTGNPQQAVNLFVVNAATGEEQRLTDSYSVDVYPAWSPDGQWIAFMRYEGYVREPQACPFTSRPEVTLCHHADLYLIRPDGADLRLLQEAVYLDPYSDNALAWSPDSQWLAVLLDDSQDIPDVAVINAASGEARPLAASPARDFSPSWSPDGQQLAIVTDRDGNLEIYVVSISGEKIINLTRSPTLDALPAWSPSGRQIAFVSNRETLSVSYLYVMDADGSGVTKLGNLIPTSHLLWLPRAPP